MSDEKEKAIGYCRVSTREQSETGVSLDAQENKIKAFAEYKGLELIEIIREEGVSASIPLKEREGGQKLLQMIKEKKAESIVSAKLDRLFRDAHDCLGMIKIWEKDGTKLHLLDLGVDFNKATGKAFLTNSATFAELERNLISERTRDGLEQVKKEGVRLGAEAMGWRRSEEKDEKGRYKQELVLDEINLILRVRQLRSEGLTFQHICDLLERDGIRTKRGKKWYPTTIKNLCESTMLCSTNEEKNK